MTKLVQISSHGFSTTMRQFHVGCRLGQVVKICKIREYILKNLKTNFERKKTIFPRYQPTSKLLINVLLIIPFVGLEPNPMESLALKQAPNSQLTKLV